MSQEWSRNHSIALEAAEDASGLTREQLADLLAEDAAFVPLSVRLLYAAGISGYEPTLRAMGAIFGQPPRSRAASTSALSSLEASPICRRPM